MRVFLFLVLLVSSAYPVTAFAKDYHGQVVAVHDGDTFTLALGNNHKIRIRLAMIDAPELDQPYGPEARDALSALLLRQEVLVHGLGYDKYKRLLGVVQRPSDTQPVHILLLSSGDAWVYVRSAHDQGLVAIEDQAKTKKRGLWSLPEAAIIPPWKWRHRSILK